MNIPLEDLKQHTRFGYVRWLGVFVRASYFPEDLRLPKAKRRFRVDVSSPDEPCEIVGKKATCKRIDLGLNPEFAKRVFQALVKKKVRLHLSRTYILTAKGKRFKTYPLKQLN